MPTIRELQDQNRKREAERIERERYPQHNRLRDVADKSQVIGEFVDWLADTKQVWLGHDFTFRDVDDDGREYENPQFTTFGVPRIQDLLAEFFGIALVALEAEKREMLDEIRAANA